MTIIAYKIDIEGTIKDLKKKIKDITFQRSNLLRNKREYREKLRELKQKLKGDFEDTKQKSKEQLIIRCKKCKSPIAYKKINPKDILKVTNITLVPTTEKALKKRLCKNCLNQKLKGASNVNRK